MILLIDNYDSFVFNLARYLRELGCETEVVRNDALSVEDARAGRPEAIVLSPGPCSPAEAGICVELVRRLSGALPILGVCLGHQAIAAAFGGRIERAPEPVHGRSSPVTHSGVGLFAGLPSPLTAGRYHSLIVSEAALPSELQVTCRSTDGLVMGLQHASQPTFGVQFHPESILTSGGHRLLSNFLQLAGCAPGPPPAPESVPASASSSPPDDFFSQPILPDAAPPW